MRKYGTPEEINRKAEAARAAAQPAGAGWTTIESPYLNDLEWLIEQRDRGAFISVADYRRKVLGPRADDDDLRRRLRRHAGDQRAASISPG